MIKIRHEQSTDINIIREINEKAFDRKEEANLIDELREEGALEISLVATVDDKIVGHIAFSLVTINPGNEEIKSFSLSCMAVLPEYQNQGIGSKLVEERMKQCEEEGVDIIIVIGHPNFYPKFGFVSSKQYGIEWEHEVPEEALMVKPLKDDILGNVKGAIKYHHVFDQFC